MSLGVSVPVAQLGLALFVTAVATTTWAAPPALSLDEAALLEHTRSALRAVPAARRPSLLRTDHVVLVGHRVHTNYRDHPLGRYDDVLVVLYVQDGAWRARAFAYSSETSGQFEGMFGQDVDGDGARDLGRLPAGTYRYRLSRSKLLGRVLRPEADQLVDRDVFHDGTFRGGRRSSAGTSILFHTGLHDDDTWSAGCQTLAPGSYAALLKLLDEVKPRHITYVLIDDAPPAPG
jgi:hypothetical protein